MFFSARACQDRPRVFAPTRLRPSRPLPNSLNVLLGEAGAVARDGSTARPDRQHQDGFAELHTPYGARKHEARTRTSNRTATEFSRSTLSPESISSPPFQSLGVCRYAVGLLPRDPGVSYNGMAPRRPPNRHRQQSEPLLMVAPLGSSPRFLTYLYLTGANSIVGG